MRSVCVRTSSGSCCWAGNIAQFATERLTSQGLPVKQRKNITMYHGTCGAQFHSSCGVVVEWQMYAWHCTCGAQSISLVEQREMEKHLSWHMCCAVSFVIWGCGGVGNGNVVERGCGWWVDAPEHCTCAVIYACSYVLVALICVIVHFPQVFSPMYVSHLWFLIVGRHLFFLGHGVS